MKKLNELMRNNQNRLLLEVSDNIMGMNLDVLLNIAIVILFYGPFQKLPHTVKKKKLIVILQNTDGLLEKRESIAGNFNKKKKKESAGGLLNQLWCSRCVHQKGLYIYSIFIGNHPDL